MNKIKYFLLAAAFILNNVTYSNQNSNPQVDSVIHAFMSKWDIPGGSFTMMYNKTLLYTKAYGYADVGNLEPATNASLFRIASCTKPFTAVAIMQLIQAGLINLTDKVFGPTGILNQPQYQTILDSSVLLITVENLLEHTGGWDDNYQPDPMFYAIEIAEWDSIPSPPMQETIIEYVLSQMTLIHQPGTYYAYSNFGYCVLGRVIEKVTGAVYEDYIRDSILVRIGAGSMQLGKSLLSGRYPHEVKYYGCPGETTTISVYDTTQIVPWPYGGFNIEAMDSHGDWIASSLDLIKFLYAVHTDKLIRQHTYNIMITPPAVNPYYAKGWAVNGPTIFHIGSLPGTISEVVKASNQYMWTLVFNKRDTSANIDSDLDDLGWTIQQFLPPPPTDSCPITGPELVRENEDNIYSTGISTENWHIANYGGAAASIQTFLGNSIIVYSGQHPGSYTVYKTTGGSTTTVLCSLHVNIELALPVEIVSFVSAANGRDVKLNWITSSEQNNSGFNVERLSTDANLWTTRGFVNGNGNSNTSNSYEFVDKNLSTGTYKYRLKQIDYNGNYEYYNLNNDVIIGTPEKYSLSANYPNPFNPQTTIDFQMPFSGNVKLIVFDVSGKEILTILNEFRDAGYYSVNFDASLLSSGVYFYKMESGNFSMARKMMVMK